MARIYLSEVIQNISGSIGNHVYSCWKGLNYIRNKAVSILNPRSVDQANMRAKAGASAQRWYSTLTGAQRDLWNEYAQQQGAAAQQTGPNGNGGAGTKSLIPGNGGVMSGFNAYVMINSLAYSGDTTAMATFVDDAPLGIDAPTAPTTLGCTWNGATCCPDLTWVDPSEVLVGSRIRIWGVSLDGGAHRQLMTTAPLEDEAASVCQIRAALGAIYNVRDLPGHYHFQIDAIGPNGQKSPPSNICQLTVPAACTPA